MLEDILKVVDVAEILGKKQGFKQLMRVDFAIKYTDWYIPLFLGG